MSTFSISLCTILLALAANVSSISAESTVHGLQRLDATPKKFENQMLSVLNRFTELIETRVNKTIEPIEKSVIAKFGPSTPLIGKFFLCLRKSFEAIGSTIIKFAKAFITIVSNFRALNLKIGSCYREFRINPAAPKPSECVFDVAGETALAIVKPLKFFVLHFVRIYVIAKNLPNTASECILDIA